MASNRVHRGQNPPPAAPPSRQNEWFIPRDGIDREVITADICRYLGNDALVRPGTYDDRETGRQLQGYYITAYRNLTDAMISDLKTDSSRWEQERRHPSGGTILSPDNDTVTRKTLSNTTAAQRYTNSELRTGGHVPQFDQPGSAYQINPMREPDLSHYPGNDAAGYSGNDVPRSAAGFPPYGSGGGAPGYGAQQYPPQSAGYGARPPEPRTFANPGGNGQYGQPPPPSFGGHQSAMEAPYVATVNFAPQQRQQDYGHTRGDINMGEAPPSVNPRSSYPPTSGPAGYGNVQPAPSYSYAQSQAPSSQAMAYAPQPMDAFYGRQPFQAGSVPPPSSGPMQTDVFPSSPTGHPMSYSPAPDQFEQSHPPPSRGTTVSSGTLAASGSGGSVSGVQRRDRDSDRDRERERDRERDRARERERRERDRDDREPEATRRRHR